MNSGCVRSALGLASGGAMAIWGVGTGGLSASLGAIASLWIGSRSLLLPLTAGKSDAMPTSIAGGGARPGPSGVTTPTTHIMQTATILIISVGPDRRSP